LPILQKGRATVEWRWWCHRNANKGLSPQSLSANSVPACVNTVSFCVLPRIQIVSTNSRINFVTVVVRSQPRNQLFWKSKELDGSKIHMSTALVNNSTVFSIPCVTKICVFL